LSPFFARNPPSFAIIIRLYGLFWEDSFCFADLHKTCHSSCQDRSTVSSDTRPLGYPEKSPGNHCIYCDELFKPFFSLKLYFPIRAHFLRYSEPFNEHLFGKPIDHLFCFGLAVTVLLLIVSMERFTPEAAFLLCFDAHSRIAPLTILEEESHCKPYGESTYEYVFAVFSYGNCQCALFGLCAKVWLNNRFCYPRDSGCILPGQAMNLAFVYANSSYKLLLVTITLLVFPLKSCLYFRLLLSTVASFSSLAASLSLAFSVSKSAISRIHRSVQQSQDTTILIAKHMHFMPNKCSLVMA